MDGTIERGYGGLSFFFANGSVLPDLTRATEYARLLASIKINGVILTNVNADPVTLKPENIKGLGRIGDAMISYGVQIGIALNFASPQTLGGLPTFDPLDEGVISWWRNVTAEIYGAVPDFGGFLVKANSEGQPGPLTYNRTLAQGANLFADALKPYGGMVMFRAFVYNLLNISDWRADRASAAYEAFQGLDGAFKDNVIVQIKAGPLDFQVREPASPLFGYLRKTNVAIELPMSQEYLDQQSHTVYLPPLWKSVLDMDLRVDNESSRVSDIVTGRRFKRQLGGFAGVSNAGSNATWMGSHLAMSNLYAYGRLAWNPAEDSETIVRDWSLLTFGLNRPMKFAFSIDGNASSVVQPVPDTVLGNYPTGWTNAVETDSWTVNERIGMDSGVHNLMVWLLEPGLVLQKIVDDLGGLQSSYLGPTASVRIENEAKL